jgi:NADH-quinone oxidoreductase subunit L
VQLLGLEAEQRFLLDRLFTWIAIGNLHVDVAFQLDPLSSVMILIITGVGGLIHIYSTGYMHEEPAYWRYFAYLNLFTFAMLTLVLADNLLLMFVGWEGVGLCSWALIGFWYSEWNNTTAGNKAFIVNRVGDFGFMLGTFLLFWALSSIGHPTLVFREIAAVATQLEGHTVAGLATLTVVTLLMFVGATGKSAQIPLYVWLPDAMAGPTPVSALIHAATMVTAGVYMIGRLNFLFTLAPATLHVIAIIGVLTAFFAATIGLAQNDIKKVLAYSTVSQLGYMFVAMGVGAYAAGIFHLVTHAFFKACLFLGSGSVIYACHHEQDMRKMGGLRQWMPITHWTFVIATAAIMGFPGTSGFFSKDEILEQAFVSPHGSFWLWLIGVAAAAMTSFYMWRQVFMTFYGEYRGGHHDEHGHADEHGHDHADAHGHGGHAHPHESPPSMTVPLVLLAAASILAGGLGVTGLFRQLPVISTLFSEHYFEKFLEPVLAAGAHAGHAHAPSWVGVEGLLTVVTFVVIMASFFLAYLIYNKKTVSADAFANLGGGALYRLIYNKYYVDELYQIVFVNGVLALSRASAWFDQNVIDFLVNATATVTTWIAWAYGQFDKYVVDGAVNGIAWVASFFGARVRQLQTGSINGYLYVIVLAVVGVMVAQLWWGAAPS